MGYSKATKARLANLPKASSSSHRPTVEEILDLDDDGEYLPGTRWNDTVDGPGRFFFVEDYSDSDLDLDSVSDLDLKGRDLEDEENEIIDDVTLLTFTNVLWRAQEIAVEEENKNGVKGRGQKGTQRPQFVPSNDMFRSVKSLNQEARNLFTPSFQRRRA